MSVTEEIKARLDIVEIVGEQVSLRKSGNSYSGFCPFHANSRTPAFVVFPHTQTWRCFGACADGGDVFSYVMKKEGWDFKEALTQLADRAGVVLREKSPAEEARQSANEKLTALLGAAADYFHQLLLHAPQAESVRAYVVERGLTEETIATFRLGYALESWDACRTHFMAQGYGVDDLLAAGLLTRNEERGTTYDRFRDRFIIPIRSADGRTVGFGARALQPDAVPKYLNSPQTALFDKSNLLFGLDMARRHVREARQAVIVEGYMDVMMAWQNGFRNVVAQMGTALTDRQLALLKRYTKRFVIALDSDAAGVKATMRSLEVARDALDREAEVRFDARGLIHHEGRLQADIRIVTLPPGDDPDSLIRRDPTLWPQLVAGAQPIVGYVIEVLTRDLDAGDPKAKTAVAQQILPIIGDVADPIERDHYRQQLARILRVDERALRRVATAPRTKRSRPVVSAAGRPPEAPPMPHHPDEFNGVSAGGGFVPPPPDGPFESEDEAARPARRSLPAEDSTVTLRERNYLRQCLAHPPLLAQVDQRLVAAVQEPVDERDFSHAEDQQIFRALRGRLQVTNVVTVEELCDSLPDPLRERVRFLLTLPAISTTHLERLPDNLVLSVLDWRLEKIRQRISEVQALLRETREDEDTAKVSLFRDQLQALPLAMAQINKAKGTMATSGRRRS